MGPSIIYSEQSNEELEELFRTIVTDDEFLHICRAEFEKNQMNPFDEIHSNPGGGGGGSGEVVHEINMSISYNVQVDEKNPDVKYVRRSINIIPGEEKAKTNRFSNLKLSNDIDQFVKMHDFVHHQPKPKEKVPLKRRTTLTDPKRRATISSFPQEKTEFAPDVLAKIVEEQLEAARRAGALSEFRPIEKPSREKDIRSQTKFRPAPTLQRSSSRHRIDQIEYSKTNLKDFARRPLSTVNINDEREKILRETRRTIQSSDIALKEKKIPFDVKSIDLIEVPSSSRETNVRLVRYETLKLDPKTSSKPKVNVTPEEKSPPTKLTSPLKSIKRQFVNQNSKAKHNPQVSKGMNEAFEEYQSIYWSMGSSLLTITPTHCYCCSIIVTPHSIFKEFLSNFSLDFFSISRG